MRTVSVAVPVPALALLTYLVPEGVDLPALGARVLVPLGSRTVTGCVTGRNEATTSAADERELKPLLDVVDDCAFVPGPVVDLVAWVAEYYACGPGEAIAAAMPPFAWVESERAVEITPAGRAAVNDGLMPSSATEIDLLRMLVHGKPVAIRLLAGRLSRTRDDGQPVPVHLLAKGLERRGLLAATTALRGRTAAFKTTRVASLTPQGIEAAEASARGERSFGQKQQELLRILAGSPDGLAFAVLGDRGISPDTIQRLSAKGFVSVRTVRIGRDPFRASALLEPAAAGSERVLTDEQTSALARLTALVEARRFAVALVHGVTGSGKTELYLRIARKVVAAGRSVLILVPEIALTPALASLVRATFGDRVAIQHSGLSDGERHDEWHRIRRGEVDVVVGTRSAVFAPLPSIGLVVVDEEHDASYKQDESPRYHGRDVAVMRAKAAGALVVLGSATPAMETYQHALAGRYEHLVLQRRVLDRPLANVRVVNMRDEYAAEGPAIIVSEPLRVAIDERLQRREQVLVLLNRRGFATAVFCRQCGGTLDCPNCSVSLTIHGRHTRRGRCHYCNYSMFVPATCPHCAAPYLEQTGVGTEQLEQEVLRLFPAARVARLDRDVASRRGATVAILGSFAAGEIDILIGTQMIAKGHDFPRVTLVGVISADVGLGLPDFRASERTFQMLTQVVGRAGRGERSGEAFIQTVYPEHYSVRMACQQDYPAFFEEELRFRRAMKYPPEVSLVNAIVRGPNFAAAMEDASDLVQRVRALADGRFRVIGPAPAAYAKLRGEHRAQFFVKGNARSAMRRAVQSALAARPDLRRRVTIDVDPITVL